MERHTTTTKKSSNIKSISSRILLISLLSVISAAVICSGIALNSMKSMNESMLKDAAVSSLNSIKKELNSLEKITVIAAKSIAANAAVKEAVALGDTNKIINTVNEEAKLFGIEVVTVSDASGKVLARTHEPQKFGDDISNQNNIKKALAGETITEIEPGTATRYAIKAGAPVYDANGKVIGVISASYKLDDPQFLDELKAAMGVEFTIFAGDERINTTLMDNGKRAIGTKLNPKIAELVINQKQQYMGKTKIFGTNYMTIYDPIMSDDGSTVTGVLFCGENLKHVEQEELTNVVIISVVALISVLSTILFTSNRINKSLKIPLKKVVAAAKAIEDGVIDESVKNEMATITSKDEMGLLARSMEGAVNSIQMIANDTNILTQAAAHNDLTVAIDTSAHRGMYKSIVEIVEKLFYEMGIIVRDMKNIADEINSGSAHVSAAAQSLAQGATEQASSTEELAATIAEIAQHVKVSAENANGASKLSQEAGEEVGISSKYMNDMLAAMNEIKHNSEEINKIVKTIDDIAFQTNILALNAAVEAARAGAAGKGFGVVADEVRNLATKSAEAAKSTTALIDNAAIAVNKGAKLANDTEIALKNVVEKSKKVNAIVDEIAHSAQMQSDSIYQINLGVDQISSVVQTNSATAEETAGASEELAGQAQMLQSTVSKYKVKDQNVKINLTNNAQSETVSSKY